MYKVHVWVCGEYAGAYSFATLAEADCAEREKKFNVLGCYYEVHPKGKSVL